MANVRHTNGGIEAGLIQATAGEPRQWQVGDLTILTRDNGVMGLIVGIHGTDYGGIIEMVCADGGHFQEYVEFSAYLNKLFSHNTRLEYEFQNWEQVQRDFQNHLFTPHFEIL